MADVPITRPVAGQTQQIIAGKSARMVLNFPADQATMARVGDSLVFKFEDDARIELSDFYTNFDKDSIPEFQVDGRLIAGADFFSAFGPDLAPAAGPATSAASGRYSTYDDADLTSGINHLDEINHLFDSRIVEGEPVSAMRDSTTVAERDGAVGVTGDVPANAIADTQPVAVSEFDSTTKENGNWTAKGNVLSGEGTVDAFNVASEADDFGANGRAAENGLTFVDAVRQEDGSFKIEGQYGNLVVDADGEYQYTLDPARLENNWTLSEPATITTASKDGFSIHAFQLDNIDSTENSTGWFRNVQVGYMKSYLVNSSAQARTVSVTDEGFGVNSDYLFGPPVPDADTSTVGVTKNVVIPGVLEFTHKEGLLLTLDNPGEDPTGQTLEYKATVHLTGLDEGEKAMVFFYGANGTAIGTKAYEANGISGGAVDVEYVGAQQIGNIVVLAENDVASFKVGGVEYTKYNTPPAEKFSYTLTDADGDTDSAVLTISLADAITDTQPVVMSAFNGASNEGGNWIAKGNVLSGEGAVDALNMVSEADDFGANDLTFVNVVKQDDGYHGGGTINDASGIDFLLVEDSLDSLFHEDGLAQTNMEVIVYGNVEAVSSLTNVKNLSLQGIKIVDNGSSREIDFVNEWGWHAVDLPPNDEFNAFTNAGNSLIVEVDAHITAQIVTSAG